MLRASSWLLVATQIACTGSPSSNPSAAERSEPRSVRVAVVAEQPFERTIVIAADLAAEEQAMLGMKVPGRLETLSVDVGSSVAAGQVIARLESTEYRLRVLQAEASLRQAQARLGLPAGDVDEADPETVGIVRQARAMLDEARITLARVRTFVERGLSAQAELDAADAGFKVADSRYQDALGEARSRQALVSQQRVGLELAREQLAGSVLSAPFAGKILARAASPGQFVSVGDPIATLVRVHPLRLRAEIPERSAAAVRLGQPVRVTIEGDREVYLGTVARISPAISADNRTLLVEAQIPNDPARLRPGSFARAEIVVRPGEPTLALPFDAVVSFAGVDKVFVVHDGKAAERRVRLGRRVGDVVEVASGVAAGDAVVVKPGNLVAGEPVRVARH